MDQGLFSKHIRNILERNSKKKELIQFLLEKTGVCLDESEIIISKKDISFSVSSVKKSILLKKGLADLVESKGMRLIS